MIFDDEYTARRFLLENHETGVSLKDSIGGVYTHECGSIWYTKQDSDGFLEEICGIEILENGPWEVV